MCALSFAGGSYCNFRSYTKIIFCGTFLYTQKEEKLNPVHVRIFLSQILRALLSNKNGILHY